MKFITHDETSKVLFDQTDVLENELSQIKGVANLYNVVIGVIKATLFIMPSMQCTFSVPQVQLLTILLAIYKLSQNLCEI